MSRFVYEDELDRIDLGEGDWIDIRRHMSYAAFQKLMLTYFKDGLKGGEPDVKSADLEKGNAMLLELNVRAWNLKGRDGQEAPINSETIALLDAVTIMRILKEINSRNPLPKV